MTNVAGTKKSELISFTCEQIEFTVAVLCACA